MKDSTPPMTKISMKAPVAKIVPKRLEIHGDVRIDNYYWLRERENPEVISYLNEENTYTKATMAHTEDLQEQLFNEIKGRIKQDDSSVPYQDGGYYYYTRYEEGKQYPFYCRKAGSLDADEEIILDANAMAEGHSFFSVRGRAISSDESIIAYATDTRGRRIYTLQFKNLATGEIYDDKIEGVTGNMAWADDNQTLFYARKDLETLRSYQIYKHILGTESDTDELVFEETDEEFSCYVSKTKSKEYLMIGSYQTLSSEVRYLKADNPTGTFEVFLPREENHEYEVDHLGENFYVLTNWEAENFRLMKTPIGTHNKSEWVDVISHRDDMLISSFELFRDHLVLQERGNALVHLRVINWDGSGDHYLDFGEPAYVVYISTNRNMNTTQLRYSYASMTTPNSIYDYDMVSKAKVLLKEEEVLGGFDKSNYKTERLFASARDGVKVPISLVYRKGIKLDGSNPLLLYSYGSYGSSSNASFSSSRLSLVDRGFVYAIAHIRGGQEMGRQWYENGKLLKKKNTFTDFIDVADYLVEEGYTRSEHMFATGGSAGGLLMGAVLNMRPLLFKGIVTRVPWVDVITTMLDPDIPLTTSEYDEWGNPNNKEYYDYMLSYSPYDQVEAKAYTNMLVTTGLHDSQVQYWEPAKWVAKLRAMKTDDNRLLLKTNMEAGHGGASGRFDRYRETALTYAFILDLTGIGY